MPIVNTPRDVRASRFETSASNLYTETHILKGPVVHIPRIVGISRRTSCILFT